MNINYNILRKDDLSEKRYRNSTRKYEYIDKAYE